MVNWRCRVEMVNHKELENILDGLIVFFLTAAVLFAIIYLFKGQAVTVMKFYGR